MQVDVITLKIFFYWRQNLLPSRRMVLVAFNVQSSVLDDGKLNATKTSLVTSSSY